MKNSNDTSWDRTRDLLICSTAPYPLCYRFRYYSLIIFKSWFLFADDGVTDTETYISKAILHLCMKGALVGAAN